mmetsp:Transcript_14599/g.26179  ORF Transcript_14599/g.26179 Transcript_14599/m.26179 type:complete len:996 (-) Transcript_14599:142-3129(-)
MVKAVPAKRKSNANTDFKRVKRKVGRKAPQSSTDMDTSFKAKTVRVKEQSVVADKGDAILSSRNLSINELLAKLKHHNGAVRKDAVEGLIEIVDKHRDSSQLRAQLPTIMTTIIELVNDEERPVREALRTLLSALLKLSPSQAAGMRESSVHWCQPFFKLIVFHICAGLSALQMGRRLDALSLLEILLSSFPQSVKDFELSLVTLTSSLLKAVVAQVGGRKQASTKGPGTATSSGAVQNAGSNMQPKGLQAQIDTGNSVAISCKTGGIMHNFKLANKKKTQKRVRESRDVQEQNKLKQKVKEEWDKLATTAEASAETWFKVAHAFLRILQHVAPSAIATQQASAAQTITKSSYTEPITRVLNSTSDRIVTSGPSDTERKEAYTQALQAVTALWNHGVAIYQGPRVAGGAAAAKENQRKMLDQFVILAELVRTVSRELAHVEFEPKPVDELLTALKDSFPIRATVTQSKNTAVMLASSNLTVARAVLCFSRDTNVAMTKLNKEAKEALVEKTVQMLAQILKDVEFENAREVRQLPEVVSITHVLVSQGGVAADSKKLLDEALLACLSNWFDVASAPRDGEVFKVVFSLLTCVELYITKWCSESDNGGAQRPVPEAWIKGLPRLVWYGFQVAEDAVEAGKVASKAFQLLKRCAIQRQPAPYWTTVANSLAPLLFTQTKKTLEPVFGPFLGLMSQSVKLEALDLIGSLPVPFLPENLIRALARTVDAIQSNQIELHPSAVEPEEVHFLLSRLIQTPFLFAPTGTLTPTDAQVVADLVSFSASIVWGSDDESPMSCLIESNQLGSTDLVCVQLVLLQMEAQVPVAQLAYPLIHHQLENDLRSSTSKDLDVGVLLARQMATDSGNPLRVVRLCHAVSKLHQMNGHDSFPPTFLRSLLLALSFLNGGAHDTTSDVMAKFVSICPPTELAELVAEFLASTQDNQDSSERLLSGWARAIRLSGVVIQNPPPAFTQLINDLGKQKSENASIAKFLRDVSMIQGH